MPGNTPTPQQKGAPGKPTPGGKSDPDKSVSANICKGVSISIGGED